MFELGKISGGDVIVGVLLMAVGAWLALAFKRPKLRLSGSSGSGSWGVDGQRYTLSHIGVVNEARALWFKASREPCKVEEARLFDLEEGRHVGPKLRWDQLDEHGAYSTAPVLEAGARASVFLFCKQHNANTLDYSVFDQDSRASPYRAPAPNHVWQHQRRRYEVRVRDTIGRETRIGLTLVNNSDNLSVSPHLDLRMRVGLARLGARMIWTALTKRSR